MIALAPSHAKYTCSFLGHTLHTPVPFQPWVTLTSQLYSPLRPHLPLSRSMRSKSTYYNANPKVIRYFSSPSPSPSLSLP